MPLDQMQTNGLSGDATAALIRRYRTQKRRCDEENGVLRNVVKQAKSEGIDVKAMIATITDTKLDPEDVVQFYRNRFAYGRILRIDISADDVFPERTLDLSTHASHEQDLWDAGDQGYRAGRLGTPVEDHPFEDASPLRNEYISGWKKGQAAIARELGDNVKQASPAKERPARATPGQARLAAVPKSDAPKAPRRASPKRAAAADLGTAH